MAPRDIANIKLMCSFPLLQRPKPKLPCCCFSFSLIPLGPGRSCTLPFQHFGLVMVCTKNVPLRPGKKQDLAPFPCTCHTVTSSFASYSRRPCRPPEAGPAAPWAGYGYIRKIYGPWGRPLDARRAHCGLEGPQKALPVDPSTRVTHVDAYCMRIRPTSEPTLVSRAQ